jgi:RNA polymerase sigma-70 factor (ECF subfamily)
MEKSDHDIRALVERSATGHAGSCKRLYETLVDSVYAYVRSRTYSKEQATDVTQDVFIDLFSAIQNFTYSTRGQFYSYLFVIVRRKLAAVYAQSSHSSMSTTQVEFSEEYMSDDAHPLQTIEQGDAIQVALETLNDIAREIIVLHHWSRYTFVEIALLLKMEESAVRVRHHRALKLLAKALDNN